MSKKLAIAGLILVICGLIFLSRDHLKWLANAFDDLTRKEFYLALANSNLRYVKVAEGARKEEIANILDKKMEWDEADRADFLAEHEFRKVRLEGKYFPGAYVFNKSEDGKDVRAAMLQKFNDNVEKIEPLLEKSNINLETALTIGSIIQREAGSKSDMRLISGVIWNRLFKGMSLDMDATLQYVKGSEEDGWWPEVQSSDKNIDSKYNTYQNKGLPPSPISNPGLAAIEAALSPQKTKCLFYFHKNKKIFCSETYKEHQRKIDLYLK